MEEYYYNEKTGELVPKVENVSMGEDWKTARVWTIEDLEKCGAPYMFETEREGDMLLKSDSHDYYDKIYFYVDILIDKDGYKRVLAHEFTKRDLDRWGFDNEKKRSWFGRLCVLEDGRVYDYKIGMTMYKIDPGHYHHTIELLDYDHALCRGSYDDSSMTTLCKKGEAIKSAIGQTLDAHFDKDGKLSYITIANRWDEHIPIEEVEKEHFVNKNEAIVYNSLRELKKLGLSEKDIEKLLDKSKQILGVKDKPKTTEEEIKM